MKKSKISKLFNLNPLVVVGYAVAFLGHPRYTKDIDIWMKRDQQNAKHLVEVMDQFGFGSLGLKAKDFLESDQIIQLGYSTAQIDILNTLEGFDFDQCYEKRVMTEIDEIIFN